MYQTIRDSIVALVNADYEAAYPAIPLYYDNQAFDANNLPERYCTLEIKLYGGDQINLATSPKTRTSGFVYINVYAKQGLGSRESLGMLGWFANALKYKSAGSVRFQAPEPTGGDLMGPWFCEELKVAFYSDEA